MKQSKRLATLILALDDRCFQPPPDGVGLKTMLIARDLKLIDFHLHGRLAFGRLTDAGKSARAELSTKPSAFDGR